MRQQVPGPVERAGGGLVPGHDQRQDFVQQLPVGHRRSGLPVARVDEQRHDIVAPHVIAAAARDVFPDPFAQLPELIGKGQVARGMVGVEEGERVFAGSRTRPRSRSSPNSARRTTSSVTSLMSCVTLTVDPARAAAAHLSASRSFAA